MIDHPMTPGTTYRIKLDDCCIEGSITGKFLGFELDEDHDPTAALFDTGTLGPMWSGAWSVEEVQSEVPPLERLAELVRRFNTETIQATAGGSAAKVLHEATEYAEKPTLQEGADVLITLLGAIQLRGQTADELVDAAIEKMRVNVEERTWTQQGDGSWQHD